MSRYNRIIEILTLKEKQRTGYILRPEEEKKMIVYDRKERKKEYERRMRKYK